MRSRETATTIHFACTRGDRKGVSSDTLISCKELATRLRALAKPHLHVLALFLAIPAMSCAPDQHVRNTASLRVIDSIVLHDGRGERLARPSSIAVAPNGDYYISDRLQGLAFRYSRHGILLNTIGTKGAGPGEFQSPRGFAFLGDSQVVAVDPGLRRAQRFSSDGHLIGEPYKLPFDFSMATGIGNAIWFGGSEPSGGMSVIRWTPGNDSSKSMLPLPMELHNPLLLLLGGAVIAAHPDTLVVGFGPSGTLRIASPATGRILDTLVVPVRVRRGLTETALRAATEGDGFGVLNSASSLAAIGFLPQGRFEIVFQDLRRVQTEFLSQLYLSIVGDSARSNCIDIPVPQLDSVRPLLTFHGDTLVMLEQPIIGDTAVVTVVRSLILDPDANCEA